MFNIWGVTAASTLGAQDHCFDLPSERVGGPVKPHVLLVCRSAAPRAASLPSGGSSDSRQRDAGASELRTHGVRLQPGEGAPSGGLFNSPEAPGEVGNAGAAIRGPPLLWSRVVLQLPSGHLTALHGDITGTMWAPCSLWDACCSLQCVRAAP